MFQKLSKYKSFYVFSLNAIPNTLEHKTFDNKLIS